VHGDDVESFIASATGAYKQRPDLSGGEGFVGSIRRCFAQRRLSSSRISLGYRKTSSVVPPSDATRSPMSRRRASCCTKNGTLPRLATKSHEYATME
jgi:hypothetical protein